MRRLCGWTRAHRMGCHPWGVREGYSATDGKTIKMTDRVSRAPGRSGARVVHVVERCAHDDSGRQAAGLGGRREAATETVEAREIRTRPATIGLGGTIGIDHAHGRRNAEQRDVLPNGRLGRAVDDRFDPPLLAVNLDRMVVREIPGDGLWDLVQVFVVGDMGWVISRSNRIMNCHWDVS